MDEIRNYKIMCNNNGTNWHSGMYMFIVHVGGSLVGSSAFFIFASKCPKLILYMYIELKIHAYKPTMCIS